MNLHLNEVGKAFRLYAKLSGLFSFYRWNYQTDKLNHWEWNDKTGLYDIF